jgi:hypothetical protein
LPALVPGEGNQSRRPNEHLFLRENELPQSQTPGSPEGATYEWTDAGVEITRIYFYLLEHIDIHGKATRLGPVSATLKPTLPDRIYLPLVSC